MLGICWWARRKIEETSVDMPALLSRGGTASARKYIYNKRDKFAQIYVVRI